MLIKICINGIVNSLSVIKFQNHMEEYLENRFRALNPRVSDLVYLSGRLESALPTIFQMLLVPEIICLNQGSTI